METPFVKRTYLTGDFGSTTVVEGTAEDMRMRTFKNAKLFQRWEVVSVEKRIIRALPLE